MTKKNAKKTPSKPRKGRSDSITEQVKTAQAALAGVSPPSTIRLRPKDMNFFWNIISEYTAGEWSDHALEIAALLARSMAQLEDEQFKLLKEGALKKVTSKNGTKYEIVNPRKTVVQQCAGTVLALRRSLALHARARAGEARDVGKRRAAQKEIEQGVKEIMNDDDGLIARPSSMQH